MGITATEVLPLLAPEWSRRHHPLFAVASAAEHVPWYEWTNGYAVSAGVRIPPWSQAQFNTIALASPFPAARGQALSLMQVTDDQAQADWAFTVCRGALRDSAVEVRDGAWRGLSAKRGHEAEVNALILAALRDADSDLRRRAAEQLDGSANIHRWKRDLVIGDGWEPSTPPLLPLEALALLLDLEQRESRRLQRRWPR